jgi:Flp pilus assembly protein TadG
VLLFCAWIDQQFLYSKWASSLSTLSSTEAVVHSYKAADSVIRAVAIAGTEVQRNDGDTIESRLDTNFDRAKAFANKFLTDGLYQERLNTFRTPDSDGAYRAYLLRIHNQYDALHQAIAVERERISSKKQFAEWAFLSLYVVGTLALLAASILKYREARHEAGAA